MAIFSHTPTCSSRCALSCVPTWDDFSSIGARNLLRLFGDDDRQGSYSFLTIFTSIAGLTAYLGYGAGTAGIAIGYSTESLTPTSCTLFMSSAVLGVGAGVTGLHRHIETGKADKRMQLAMRDAQETYKLPDEEDDTSITIQMEPTITPMGGLGLSLALRW